MELGRSSKKNQVKNAPHRASGRRSQVWQRYCKHILSTSNIKSDLNLISSHHSRYFNNIIISNIKAGRTNDQLKQLLGARSICNREMSVPDKCDCTHKNVNDGTHKNLNGLLLISRGSGRFWNICSSAWRHFVPRHNLVEL